MNTPSQLDPWVVAYDMGKYDHLLIETQHYQTAQSCAQICQVVHDKPLRILKRSQCRVLVGSWKTIEICESVTVEGPKEKWDGE